MREQSHKDEMSAAIRGDFRRLRERGVAVTLAPQEVDRPVRSLAGTSLVQAPAQTQAPPPRETEAAAAAAGLQVGPAEAPSVRTGFLARLLGR